MSVFAIQKTGRLVEGSIKYLNDQGIFLPERYDDLKVKSLDGNHTILFIRHMDIPTFVEQGYADFGIVAKDLLFEKQYEVKIEKELDFCSCKMVIAVPNEFSNNIKDLGGKRIATSYPESLKKYLKEKNIIATIVEINGSVEVSTEIGYADVICDVSCSGNALKKYGFKIIDELFKTRAVLI